jgi:outer membrane protein assembly factor BamB
MRVHRVTWRRTSNLLPLGSACLWIGVGACGGDAGSVTPPLDPEDSASPKVSRVTIIPAERIFGMLGVTVELAAGAYAANDDIVYGLRDDSERFSWSSSDPKVAIVEGTALRSVGEGTATITATVDGVRGSMTVTVVDRARFAWAVPIPGGIDAGNVMGPDGTIYVGTDDVLGDFSTWYAVSPQGRIVWTLNLPLAQLQMPAIGADGTLYIGTTSSRTDEGGVVAVDRAGIVRWQLQGLEAEIRSSPALGPDGTIYLAGNSHIYAVDPRGTLRWSYRTDARGPRLSSPAVARDGTVYVGGWDSRLYAIKPDGSLSWTFATRGSVISSPAIGSDGTIYFGAGDGRLYAVRPDGTERWSVVLSSEAYASVEGSPSIGADGTIYVQANNGLYAVDPGGSIRWSSLGVGNDGGTPILGVDGTVYVAGRAPPGRRGIYPLDSAGKRLGDYPKQDAGSLPIAGASPLIGVDGRIIMVAGDELIAVVEHRPTNGGFAASPWPKARGDRANSGRAPELPP